MYNRRMIWLYIILTIVILYLGISLYFFLQQEKLIFWPEKLSDDFQFEFDAPFEEFTLKFPKKVLINCLHFTTPNPKGCILMHHGNQGNMIRWGTHYTKFTKLGYDVLVYDYRTYGKSKGRLTELALIRDARRVYKHLLKTYSKEDIIHYGISLGTGIATRLAVGINCRMLILETPYRSMLEMASRKAPFLLVKYILKFHLRTDRAIKKVKCPIHIFHGTDDDLIPYKDGVYLSKLNSRASLTTFKGGKHSNLDTFESYHKRLEEILM